MPIDQAAPNTAREANRFWKLSLELSTAAASGDAEATWEAADELEVFALYADNPKIRARAAAAVATHFI
jgi:hypothetical protein